MPISQSATDAIKWFDRYDVSGNWGSAEQFASFATAVIVGAHVSTAPREVKVLSTALYIAAVQETSSSSSSSNRVVVTPAGRDALIAMSKYATTDDSVEALAKTLLYFITTQETGEMLLTTPVVDALVALARCAVTPLTVGYVSSVIGSLARPKERFLLAEASATIFVRNALVTMAPFATAPATVLSLSSAMTETMRALVCHGFTNLTDKFVTPAVIDAIISMSQFATTANAVLYLMIAFSTATDIFLHLDLAKRFGSSQTSSRRSLHRIIANKQVCDAVISLAKFATTLEAITHLVATIHAIATEVHSCSTYFANEAFRDAFVAMAPLAASPSVSCYLAEAMIAIMVRVPQSIELFACVEVMRGCGHLHRYTDDLEGSSVDRLSTCLTACLGRRVKSATTKDRARDAMDMMTECVGAAAEASQRHDLVRMMQVFSSHETDALFSLCGQNNEPVAATTVQLAEQDPTLLSHQLAAVVVDGMYAVSPTLSLRRVPKAATLSSGGCRQGDALGPLAVNANSSRPLSKHLTSQSSVGVGVTAVRLQCFLNNTTMTASSLKELHVARSYFLGRST